jgi:hypothetical protein
MQSTMHGEQKTFGWIWAERSYCGAGCWLLDEEPVSASGLDGDVMSVTWTLACVSGIVPSLSCT